MGGGFLWHARNQIGRRNLSPTAFKLALGRRYNRTKKSKAEAGAIGGSSKDQNDTCLESTAAKLATQHGVSEATVKRAGKFAEEVENNPDIKKAIAKVKTIKAKASDEVKAITQFLCKCIFITTSIFDALPVRGVCVWKR